MPLVWFQLVDWEGRPYNRTHAFYVDILPSNVIAQFLIAVHALYANNHLKSVAASDLVVYANRAAFDQRSATLDDNKEVPLRPDLSLDLLGNSYEDLLIVVVPSPMQPSQADHFSQRIPEILDLENANLYYDECNSLENWAINQVHEFPIMFSFLKDVAGCVKAIYWRQEDKMVTSILIDRWFMNPVLNLATMQNKGAIVMGSPGIGKSNMLCLMAFYLVFNRKQNVLVYRKVGENSVSIFYLGYDNGRVKYFKEPNYDGNLLTMDKTLRKCHSNVWLLLDGFSSSSIPYGLDHYKLLVTSDRIKMSGQAAQLKYGCLLPCWTKQDLFKMGRHIFKYTEPEMVERYKISGGSVREFTWDSLATAENQAESYVNRVKEVLRHYSANSNVKTGPSHLDCVRHGFVKDINKKEHYVGNKYWEQYIDSSYIFSKLSSKIDHDECASTFTWACASENNQLKYCAFEQLVHHLSSSNQLRLYVSLYQPKEEATRAYSYIELKVKQGHSFISRTSKSYQHDLESWIENDQWSCWFPQSNIDSIVKLLPTEEMPQSYAYLQISFGKDHGMDTTYLTTLNDIFAKKSSPTFKPIYILLQPSWRSCEDFNFNLEGVELANNGCQVYVGYISTGDGPSNILPIKEVKLSEPGRRSERNQKQDGQSSPKRIKME